MNDYDRAREVEDAALADLIPFCRRAYPGNQIIPTGDQAFIQKVCGDLLLRYGSLKRIEVKAEAKNIHGNFFLETESNGSRGTPGWMHTCMADWIWYYFVDDRELYIMRFSDLREWAFEPGNNLVKWPKKRQSKYDQKNDTWGHCVSIAVLKKQLPTVTGPFNPTRTR